MFEKGHHSGVVMIPDNFNIKKLTHKTKPFRKRLSSKLKAFTEAKTGPLHLKDLTLSVNGKGGKLIGGLLGLTYWNTVFIDILWAEPKYRGLGLGRQLMEQAETEARLRGCTLAHLSTHSLQAPGF
jgi:GNAT superfamily N-acetyltransferase